VLCAPETDAGHGAAVVSVCTPGPVRAPSKVTGPMSTAASQQPRAAAAAAPGWWLGCWLRSGGAPWRCACRRLHCRVTLAVASVACCEQG
jgi:hypothetical protein